MGFTGQVFAARVAIGLAMPTPQSLSKSGQIISGFAKAMYNKLNAGARSAAQERLNNASANVKKLQDRLESFDKSTHDRIQARALKSAQQTRTVFGGSFLESTRNMRNFQTGLAKQAPEVEVKLFKNVDKHLGEAAKYEQMVKNFFNLNEQERQSVMNLVKDREIGAKARLDEAKAARDGSAAKEHEYKTAKSRHEARKKEHEIFKKFYRDRKNIGNVTDEERLELMKLLTEALGDETLAQEALNDMEKEGARVGEELSRTAQQMVFTIKKDFVDGVREAVSALTAFYYKLNQNTQELITFERELLNANSVFGLTRSELFDTGNVVTEFAQKFGIEMQNGAEGLYQLASAGVSANEALSILPETLKLSMAVQGDHNTISKLTAQTLFGFNMEMSEAGVVTDKFAHAIQKSLIEYEDLSSAVKFALPFFTTTGQSIDQLLGALSVLTNRALEAGIAGRGLRQGLAELAESIGDNTARFRDFGVEVVDSQGNMLQLTEIAANFAAVLEAGVINDTELLTSLIEDLNVRGATAFVHLVQASDEFTEAVQDSEGAAGELDEMVRIQNQSLGAQIQILKSNVDAIFMMRDANYEGTEYMNAFHEALVKGVESLKDLIVEGDEGSMVLTQLGQQIQDIAVRGISIMADLLKEVVRLVTEFSAAGFVNLKLLEIYVIPLKIVLGILEFLGPELTKIILSFHILTKVLPILTIAQAAHNMVTVMAIGLGWVKMHQDSVMTAQQGIMVFWLSQLNISQSIRNWLLVHENGNLSVALIMLPIRIAQTIAAWLADMKYNMGLSMTVWLQNHIILQWIWQSVLLPILTLGWTIMWIAATAGLILVVVGLGIMLKKIYDMTDGMAGLMMFWDHFKNLIVYIGSVYMAFWTNAAEAVWNYLEGPAAELGQFFDHLFKMFAFYKNDILGFVAEVKKYIPGMAEGGYVHAMGRAAGGSIGRGGPYMVGEKGPELFVPHQSGQIVPNKALNTSGTNRLLERSMSSKGPVPVMISGGELGHVAVKKFSAAKSTMKKVSQKLNPF